MHWTGIRRGSHSPKALLSVPLWATSLDLEIGKIPPRSNSVKRYVCFFRHLENILIKKDTGEVVHVDLGVVFDQGKFLQTPEVVPFRLTREMVDGMGLYGVAGTMTK